MSSTQQGSNNPHKWRKNKADKGEKQSRRTWSQQEEAVLLEALKELVANGWKSDNGFRGGYLQRLEEAMAKECPGKGIHAFPHINSKIQIWKKNFYSLQLMLKRSGVGFNVNGKHEIDCTQEQWNQIVKCDSNAGSMRQKSWAMLDDWKEIFGKDRATGENAEDLVDAVNELMQDTNGGTKEKEDGDYNMADVEISVNDVVESSPCQSEKGEPSKVKSGIGKKRKQNDNLSCVAEIFREISRGTYDRLDAIVSRIGHDYDLDEAKKESYNLLENIPGLSLQDKFKACDIFIDNPNKIGFFKGLPESVKPEYVQHLLKNLTK